MSNENDRNKCVLDKEGLQYFLLDENNVGDVKRLNKITFPVKYDDQFYTHALISGRAFSYAVYDGKHLVAGLCSRLENTQGGWVRVYIMSVAVIPTYRDMGIGSNMLNMLLQSVQQEDIIQDVYLHVQTSNQNAIRFYSRLGFSVKETIPRYYPRLQPPDAVVLSKDIIKPQSASVNKEGHRLQ
eukprot:gb/GECH01010084.1/.p1 GENE.gb/GECH01010084.1/~~gb/GECH01010084.1/.p1  ORF type:complete len:184 (+),score=16.10 gb/GECH01010084.1/:1-552(+)